MPKQGWYQLAAFILLMAVIGIGGPYLSSLYNKKYKNDITKNGTAVNAVVFQKKTHKGNTVHFKYRFKDETYKNHEQNDSLFESLNIGDSITILLDSTDPSESYILRK